MQPQDTAPQPGPVPPATPPVPPPAQPSPPYFDPVDQARLAPNHSRNKAMLVMAAGLVVLVAAASITLTLLSHKAKPGTSQSSSTSRLLPNSVYVGEQQKARNSKREVDMHSLQTQLEAFFSQNGYYPSLRDMNNKTWLNTNMKTLDQNALTDPSNPSQSTTLVATPAANQYSYHATDSNDASCEADDTKCAKYTVTATYEGTVDGATTYSAQNLD